MSPLPLSSIPTLLSFNGIPFYHDEVEALSILAETTLSDPVAFPRTTDIGERLVGSGLAIPTPSGAFYASALLVALGPDQWSLRSALTGGTVVASLTLPERITL